MILLAKEILFITLQQLILISSSLTYNDFLFAVLAREIFKRD
mgnify:CR=1 FL=1